MKPVAVGFVLVSILGVGSPLGAWQTGGSSGFTPRGPARKSAEREWEIIFSDGISTEEYAKQLDYFNIDIGALSKNGKIEYISKVSQYKPVRRLGLAAAEYRLQIPWKSGTLHAADRRLLRKAGIGSQGKKLEHYFPRVLQKELEKLEADYAGLKRDEIRRTRFRIRPAETGKGYEFVVVEQDPPNVSENRSAVSESFEPSKER